MTMLDVLSLVVACVAIAFAVVAAVRARTAGEIAAAARDAADQAVERAQAAHADAATAGEQARDARADAANALDQATRALAEAARSRAGVAAAEASAAEAARALESASESHTESDRAHDGESSVPAVSWVLEQVKGAVWLLKNVGDGTAESALLSDATLPPKYVRPDEVIPRVVAPGDHLQFRVTVPRGGPPPRVRVTWRDDNGQPQSKDMTLLLEG